MQPARSSASQTGTSPAPLDSISSSASRASAGQGTGRAGASRPRLSAVTGDSIRPREAASAPARSPISGSLALARRPSATSPPWMIRPWSASTYSGLRSRRREAQQPALRHRALRRPYGQVDRVPDPPSRQAHLPTQLVRLVVAELPGDRVDLLQQQPVRRPARGQVQRVADVEQPLVRLAYAGVRQVGQPGGGQRAQRRHVPQPAAGLLEVRLQQVGRVTELLPALTQRVDQLRQPPPGVAPPGVQQRGPRPGDQSRRRRRPAAGRAGRSRRSAPDRPPPRTRPASAPSGRSAPGRPTAGTTAGWPARPRRPGCWPSCSRTRSRSDRGPSSRRARLPTAASATPPSGAPAAAYSSTRADSTQSVTKRRRSGPAVVSHPDRIATLRRSLVRSRFRARPARAPRFVRERCRPPEPTRPCRHRCGRSERS